MKSSDYPRLVTSVGVGVAGAFKKRVDVESVEDLKWGEDKMVSADVGII